MQPPTIRAWVRSVRASSLGMMREAGRRRGVGQLVSKSSVWTFPTARSWPDGARMLLVPQAMTRTQPTTMRAACLVEPRPRWRAHHRPASARGSAPPRCAPRPQGGGAREACGRGRLRPRRSGSPTIDRGDDPARPGRRRDPPRCSLPVERRDSQAGAGDASPCRVVMPATGGSASAGDCSAASRRHGPRRPVSSPVPRHASGSSARVQPHPRHEPTRTQRASERSALQTR